jgi:hypothetical protein
MFITNAGITVSTGYYTLVSNITEPHLLGKTFGKRQLQFSQPTYISNNDEGRLPATKVEYGIVEFIIRKHILNCTFQEQSKLL